MWTPWGKLKQLQASGYLPFQRFNQNSHQTLLSGSRDKKRLKSHESGIPYSSLHAYRRNPVRRGYVYSNALIQRLCVLLSHLRRHAKLRKRGGAEASHPTKTKNKGRMMKGRAGKKQKVSPGVERHRKEQKPHHRFSTNKSHPIPSAAVPPTKKGAGNRWESLKGGSQKFRRNFMGKK